MPQFAKGHNSLTVLKATGVGADGKKVYERVRNPKLSESERAALLAKAKSRPRKPLSEEQKLRNKERSKRIYQAGKAALHGHK